jgi:hypothetical protein
LEFIESFFPGDFNATKSLETAIEAIKKAVLLSTNPVTRQEYEKVKEKYEDRLAVIKNR